MSIFDRDMTIETLKVNGILNIPEGVTELSGDFALVFDWMPEKKCQLSFREIIIPSSVHTINGFFLTEYGPDEAPVKRFKKITVSDDNPYFKDVDGVLFSKDLTRLICYPCGKAGTSYTVPNTVEVIEDSAFENNVNLQKIILPDSLKRIEAHAFAHCAKLASINLPEGLEYIGEECFELSLEINRLTIPLSVKKLFASIFSVGSVIVIPHKRIELEYDYVPTEFLRMPFCGPAIISTDNDDIYDFAESYDYNHFENCFEDENGIIWADQGATLVCFPAEWQSENFKLPDTTQKVYIKAFVGSSLKNFSSSHNITIVGRDFDTPKYHEPLYGKDFRIAYGTISCCKNLKEDDKKCVETSEKNTLQKSTDGNHVFISYSSKNQQMADSVRLLLIDEQIPCWMAPYDIPAGSQYASVINNALENCSCLLLLLTNASQASQFVNREVERAITYKKPIIPIQLEDLVLNSGFKFYIGNSQIIAVPETRKDCPEFNRVLSDIKGIIDTSVDANKLFIQNANNDMTYNKFIEVIQKNLSISKYDAVTLTIPDKQLQWEDTPNDNMVHFLSSYKDEINNSENVLKTLKDTCEMLSNYLDYHLLYKSVVQIYTYQYHTYMEKIFRKTVNSTDDKLIYLKLYSLLSNICEECKIHSNISIYVEEIINYLANQPEVSHIDNAYDLAMYIERMFICFYKLSCFIILNDFEKTPNFSLIPITVSDYYDFAKMIKETKKAETVIDKLESYKILYTSINDKKDDFINMICQEIYEDFLRLINDADLQDNFIFTRKQNDGLRSGIMSLYKKIYRNIKYKLYRGYKEIEDDIGLMRNSLMDREIIVNYLQNNGEEISFQYIKANNENGVFVLRLATQNDITNIIKLNNPSIPYRRAIYVKSDDNEIRAAVKAKSVWIIEEQNGNERNIACVAVIIKNQHIKSNSVDSTNGDKAAFNSDFLNKEYEAIYYNEVKRDFSYLDFDSVLVNDGRSGIGVRSYRGYGFQRLCLTLAEELAKKYGCDYICATVSSFNAPSKRNFMLNGYAVVKKAVYTLTEGESDFYKYITNPETSNEEKTKNTTKVESEIKKYGTILDDLKIDRERYRKDRDVPRDFVVLKLK